MANKRKSTGNGNLKPRWKKGQSGNPKGRARKGATWTDLVAELGNMTPADVQAYAASIGRRLPKVDATLRELAVLAAYVDCIMDPNPRMLVALMERVEGKPTQGVELSGNSDKPINIAIRPVDYRAAIAPLAPGSMGDSE